MYGDILSRFRDIIVNIVIVKILKEVRMYARTG